MSPLPPGWYPDPTSGQSDRGLRWWDGSKWTQHTHVSEVELPTQFDQTGRNPHALVAAGAMTPDGEPLASWPARLGAYLIDSIVLLPLVILVSWPFLDTLVGSISDFAQRSVDAGRQGLPGPSQTDLSRDLMPTLFGLSLLSLAVNLVYNVVFLRWRSATPGKMALGLRVRLRERPGRLGYGTIVTRWFGQNIASFFAAVPILGSFVGIYSLLDGLWPLGDSKRQAIHDKVAGTNVVRRG